MIPPKEITIRSDSNILTYKDTIKTKEGLRYQYVYTRSISKKGEVLELDEQQLTKLIKVNT